VKTGDAKPPNYRATTGATSAGPPDSTDEMGLSALSLSCLCDEEVEMQLRSMCGEIHAHLQKLQISDLIEYAHPLISIPYTKITKEPQSGCDQRPKSSASDLVKINTSYLMLNMCEVWLAILILFFHKIIYRVVPHPQSDGLHCQIQDETLLTNYVAKKRLKAYASER